MPNLSVPEDSVFPVNRSVPPVAYDQGAALLESAAANGTIPGFSRNIAVGLILGSIVVGAILGNILVVLSVCTNRRLRTVTNFYVVSLALSDLCVALLVMPIGIVVEITGSWGFGPVVCELWVSCDVLLCTASILNLCCISLDRYFAITKPLVYATKRSRRLALTMIAVVWVSAVVITCPPIFGWREANRHTDRQCGLTKAPGYIIYSSLGSFYLPLMVMIFAYIRIFIVACRRERRFRPYYHHQRSLRYTEPAGKVNFSAGSDSHQESIELGGMNESRASNNGGDETSGGARTVPVSGRAPAVGSGGGCAMALAVSNPDGGPGEHSSLSLLCVRNKKRKSDQQNCNRNGGGGGGGTCTMLGGRGCIPNTGSGIGGSGATVQHANRNAFTNSHTVVHKNHSDSSYLNSGGSAGLNSKNCASSGNRPTEPSYGGTGNFSRSPSVASKRCGTYALAGKSERGRERAVLLKEHKAAKTLAVVVGGFIACWLPFFLMYVIEPFCTSCEFNPTLATFFVWLGYFNSVMNPFIYAFYNKDFRHSFWTLTLGLICGGK